VRSRSGGTQKHVKSRGAPARRGLSLGFVALWLSACFMDGKYVADVTGDTVRPLESGAALTDGGPTTLVSGSSAGLPTAAVSGPAPPSCVPGEDGSRETCYERLDRAVSWQGAVDACAAKGPEWRIMTVRRVQEHDVMKELLKVDMVDTWLGASDAESADNWRWHGDANPFYVGVSGSGAAVDGAFVQWAKSEPSATTESEQCARYVHTDGDWYWDDASCALELSAFCEKR
jgi:Lectin C-type domain